MSKIRLRNMNGADEANYSGARPYRMANNGVFEVDAEAVGPLLDRGGFMLADPPGPVAVAHGFIRLQNLADRNASCSFGGVSYPADDDGCVVVPIEAAPVLEAHGFTRVPPRR
jgi:hypothetical protein